jgi:DNA-binding NarL/FixJ family response regulator
MMPRNTSLSERQIEVLSLTTEGFCLKEIANRLGITYSTAAEHRTKLMEKLHIRELAGLVRYGLEQSPRPIHTLHHERTTIKEEFKTFQQ